MPLPPGFEVIESPIAKQEKAKNLPEGFELIDYPFGLPERPPAPEPYSVGSGILDLLKQTVSPFVAAPFQIPRGAELAVKGAARKAMEGDPEAVMPSSVYSPGLDTEETIFGPETEAQKARRKLGAQRVVAAMPSIPYAKELAGVGDKVQKDIYESLSPQGKLALKESEITGNIFKGELEFGSNPNAMGYALQVANVLGSVAPVILTAAVTRSPTAGGVVGGGMASYEAGKNAAEEIGKLSDVELRAQSPFYAQMIAGGASPQEAKNLTIQKAAESGAILQGLVATFGDRFTGQLVTGAFDNVLKKVAGTTAGRILAGGAIGMGEEAAQETTEGIAANIGIQSVLPQKELGEGSAANLILGALGGAGIGAIRGVQVNETPEETRARILSNALDEAVKGTAPDKQAIDRQAINAMRPDRGLQAGTNIRIDPQTGQPVLYQEPTGIAALTPEAPVEPTKGIAALAPVTEPVTQPAEQADQEAQDRQAMIDEANALLGPPVTPPTVTPVNVEEAKIETPATVTSVNVEETKPEAPAIVGGPSTPRGPAVVKPIEPQQAPEVLVTPQETVKYQNPLVDNTAYTPEVVVENNSYIASKTGSETNIEFKQPHVSGNFTIDNTTVKADGTYFRGTLDTGTKVKLSVDKNYLELESDKGGFLRISRTDTANETLIRKLIGDAAVDTFLAAFPDTTEQQVTLSLLGEDYSPTLAKLNDLFNAKYAAPETPVAPEVTGGPTTPKPVMPETPVTWNTIQPGQQVTLYRGENKENIKDGEWWTTNKSKAEKYGKVAEIILPSEIVGKHSVQGQGGPDEFVFPTQGNRPTDLAQRLGKKITTPEVPAAPEAPAGTPTGGPSAPAGGPAAGGTTAAPGIPEVTGGPSAPAGGPKAPKVKPTEEEKAKAEEEKKKVEEEKAKAVEEKAKVEEQKKKLAEFNKNPMKVAMDEGNADAVASLLYGNSVAEDLMPVIFPGEGLLRMPVDMGKVADIEAALTKYGFRITDRSVPATTDNPAYTGPERITISALFKPEKVSIQGGGAQFEGNRKGKVTAPPVPKDATDGQITKMLAAVNKDTLLDINSNVDNSFGAMMYKEGVVSYVLPASDYLREALKNVSGLYISDKTGSRQAIKQALERGKGDEVQKLLQNYVDALQALQKVFDSHSRVAELDLELRSKYIKDENAPRTPDKYTQDGLDLRKTLKANNLQGIFAKMYQLFAGNEDSSDQTNRVVKKETDIPPELGNIVRRGMRDHRQGRDVDVQDFINTFGLFPGGVDFGNWVNQTERAAHLNAIYDAMYDLADVSGISPKMLGLGEKLKMAVGAQGKGGKTAAHYIPKLNEINLTKTKGDGTLGHEWHHGLDFNLRENTNGEKLMSETVSMLNTMIDVDTVESNLRSILQNVANSADNRNMPPKQAFFAAITNPRYGKAPIYSDSTKRTQFFRDALALDEGREPRYWSTPTEMLSRGFESMLYDASKGGSPYLVGPDRADGYISQKNGYAGTSYPAGKERPALNEVFKQMLSQIDPDTLKVKTYKMETKVVQIEGLGYAVLDQYNLDTGYSGGLHWFKDEKEANAAKENREGKEKVLTPLAMQESKVNERILGMAKRIDAIMEEMGLFKWPEIKNGSMAESMFNHMRQGWWPKNNRDLAEYGIKAYLQNPELLGFNPVKDQREIENYKIADFEGDRIKLKRTQEDFEAAATRYVGQVITDMRAEGADTKAIYDRIVSLYLNQPVLDVKSILSKTNNAYSTPLPIAYLAGMLARVKSTTTVLDPTGGNGMLVVTANPQNVTTIEIDPERANNMRLMQIGNVIDGNAMDELKNLRDQEVDVVLANPPFGSLPTAENIPSWTGQSYKIGTLDQAIAAKSLRAMANNGRAVLILGAHPQPGTITSTDRHFLNWLYGNYNVVDHYEVGGSLYRKQGTTFPLRVLVIAGRNQTENAYPNDFTVDRITTFDELWSRYVQTSDRSQEVVVGAGKKQPTTGGANRPAGGVPAGGALEDGKAGEGVGAGEGAGVGKPLPPTGRGNIPSDTGGRGTAGPVRPGEQQPDTGKGKRGGSGGVETGGPGGREASGEGSGAELGGLSDLDLDSIFDDLGKPEKPKGGPRAPRGETKGPKEPRAPRGPSVKGPTVIPKELEGLGLEGLLEELDAALNGKPAEVAKGVTPEDSQERLDKQANEAMGRIAQDTKNTSDDPNSGLYSRKGDQDYANVQPIIQKVWNAVGEKITDAAQRIKQVYALLVTKFGDPIKAHLRTFVESLRTQVQRRPKNQTPVQAEPIDSESRVVYLGKSRFSSDGIYLPRAQSQHAYSALENLEAQVGNIDEFVANELGYPSVEKMAKGLAGYQIDGLALAIQANKLGKGFIIGDDTGVGKGRAAAAMIVWAKKNGKIPIFATVNDSMYTSMYEDLINIGHEDIKIGMTNNNAIIQKDIGNGKTKIAFQNKDKNGPDLMAYIIKNGELPKGMDVLFTAYSQLNGGRGSESRQNAIASLVAAGKAVLVMDEAHNAAGVPTKPDSMGQNAFFMSLLTGKNLLGKDKDAPEDWKPPPAVYLSATFAKRPDNMPLYIHTNLRYAANTPEELTELFNKGVKTDVLQQVSSEMLVESGSMLRRERSYEGVTMEFVTDDANAPRDIREVDKVTTILRSLVNADRALKEWMKSTAIQNELITALGPAGAMLGKIGPTAFAEAKGSIFTSVVHNYIGTLLLSAKTQTAVDTVVDKMNNGEKVVVGLKSTNGSALDDFVEKNGIKVGDEIPNFGWQTLIQRAIDSTRRITLKSATGNDKDNVKVEIPYSMMPPSVRAGYDNLANMLKDFQSDLPVAPIDYIRTELERKFVWVIDGKTNVGDTPPPGVKARNLVVREITGRGTAVDYRGDVPKYMSLNNPERVSMISSFQNGDESENGPIDVLIINSAGATGISLHASVNAFDQRPRHMIILQPHGDISVFIQLLGRIHRTGQVEWPSFTMLATGIPAERRILAMLRKKLSSLKSNTSGGSSSTKVDGVDFINRYGDVATAEYLNEHADIREFLGEQLFADPAEQAGSDLAHKASGTAGLLSSADQQEFFDSIEASYLAEIELRNATGTNALERRVLPLNAEMIKENLIEEGLDSTNPFLTDVVMAQLNVDIIGSIPTEQNVRDDIAQALNGRTAQQVVDEIETDLNTVFIEVRNQIILKQQALAEAIAAPGATEKDREQLTKQKEGLDLQFATLGERKDKTLNLLRNEYAIGNGFDSFILNNVPASSVVIGVKVDKARIGKSKTGNPYSPSNFQVIFKRNIPEGRVAPTLATLEGPSIEMSRYDRRPPLGEWFALKSVTGGRTSRYIALGNILRAAQLFDKDGGEIAKFTLMGQLEPVSGVVMPAKYQPVAISAQPVRFRNPNAAVQYVLAAWNQILMTKYEQSQVETYKETADKLKPLMLPNLPDFSTLGELQKNSYSLNVIRGANNMWTLTLESYRPTNFRLTISGDAPKKFITSPPLKELAGNMAKKSGTYDMEKGQYITDPNKIVALVKFLHKNYPATVEADFGTLAREVMKVEFDDSESKKGMMSRGVAEGGQSVEAVQEQIVPIEGIDIRVVQSADQLPDDAAPSDVEGAWYSGRTVYLVADNLPNAKRVQEVLAHEAIGHAALEAMLSPQLMKELVTNVQNLEKTSAVVKKIAAYVDNTQPGLSKERRAKEIVAVMAERGLYKGLVQRVIQAVRNFLRKAGFTIDFTDGDVLEMLRYAEAYVARSTTPKLFETPMYSRNIRGGPATLATWQAPIDLKITDSFLYRYVDKFVDTKNVIEGIKREAGRIEDAWDPYLKEELYHGRTATQSLNFLKNELRPFVEKMDKMGVDFVAFEEYLHNRHAKIRNEVIAQRNLEKPDGGSGLFNVEVDEYMEALDKDPGLKKKYEDLAKTIDDFVKGTQDLLVSSGLEKQSTIDAWRESLPFYVPLNRDPDELDFVNPGSGMGKGISVSGPFAKAAIGSTKTVKDIIGNIALQRERAIVRGEKARIGRALYALAIQNPNPNFWMPINPDAIKNKRKLIDEMVNMGMSPSDADNLIQEPQVGKLDTTTGLVKYQVNPMARYADNVVSLRINGEDRYVFFNPGNPVAKRMAEALKNIDAAELDGVLSLVGEITRTIASLNTQYNPVFGAFNFLRDVQGAAINLSNTPIADRKMEVIFGSFANIRAIYRALRDKPATSPEMQERMDLFKQYQDAGGQTGFRERFVQSKEKATIIQRELSRLNRGNVKKVAQLIFDWLSDFNDTAENAVRLAAFKAALDAGQSEDRAASIAKNITVNFNRRGADTTTLGALYAFLNARIQGTARQVQTLTEKDAKGKIQLSSVGKKIIAGGMFIGVAQAAILAAFDFGPDDPPEWAKSKNLILPVGGGGYIMAPMPLGMNVFPNVGRIVTEYMLVQSGNMEGRRDIKETVTYLTAAVLDAFNPIGAGTFGQMISPTAADPLIGAFVENKDAFGRPIYKEDRALAPTPGYQRSRESANEISQAIAYGLNYITGGGERGIGFASPTADQISYIASQYAGGLGKLGVQTYEYAKSKITGEEVQQYQVPVAGKLYGDLNTPAAISGKFYDNIIEMSKHENIVKDMKGKGVEEYYKENPEARLWNRANYVENAIARIKKEKATLTERKAPDAQIKRKDEQIKQLMESFNKEVTKRQ